MTNPQSSILVVLSFFLIFAPGQGVLNPVTTLIIATRNLHKVQEIRTILGAAFTFQALNDYPSAPQVVEDGDSFETNASKKSIQLAQWLAFGRSLVTSQTDHSGMRKDVERFEPDVYCLADDSGLEVDALGGAPGVHSARFAALETGNSANSNDQSNNAKLLRLLETVSS